MLFEKKTAGKRYSPATDGPRGIVDGLVIGNRDVWVVVAPRGEDMADWLDGGDEIDGGGPLMVCRAVSEAGTVLLDDADPLRDRLLSQFGEKL